MFKLTDKISDGKAHIRRRKVHSTQPTLEAAPKVTSKDGSPRSPFDPIHLTRRSPEAILKQRKLTRKMKWAKWCPTVHVPTAKMRAAGTRARHSRDGIFEKAYLKWLVDQSPEECARLLRDGTPMGVTQTAKKSLFLGLYQDMWPDKVQCLRTCGLSVHWLKEICRKDMQFAADLLEIELYHVDTLKAYSYEQAFHPANVQERLFWLKTIASDEFGEEPLINLNLIQAVQTTGFTTLETLLKKRQELEQKRGLLIAQSEPSERTD